MKNIIAALVLFCGMFNLSNACESNGFCNRPSGRVLSTTKSVVREVVRVPTRVVTTLNSRRVTRVK